jgi:hypothetical protein
MERVRKEQFFPKLVFHECGIASFNVDVYDVVQFRNPFVGLR